MNLRAEGPADVGPVDLVNRLAFGQVDEALLVARPGVEEAFFARTLRDDVRIPSGEIVYPQEFGE